MNYKILRSKLGDLVLLTKISASYLPSRDPIDGFNMVMQRPQYGSSKGKIIR